MAKQGMHRAFDEQPQKKNRPEPVALIQGKAKSGKEKARPVIAGTQPPALQVYHSKPHAQRPGGKPSPAMDTDLAFDNMANDLPEADLQDF